jgi:hypothetical protein
LLSFQWCAKQLRNNHIWYINNDYSTEGPGKKFLDGIGTLSEFDLSIILIESSSYNQGIITKHALGDTLKQLKNATDTLKHLTSKCMNSDYSTLKKVKIFTVHIIQERMTLISSSIQSPSKWEVVECRSCDIPTTYEDRFLLVNVFEFFAFLYDELESQKKILQDLQKQQLGIIEFNEENSVRNILFSNNNNHDKENVADDNSA